MDLWTSMGFWWIFAHLLGFLAVLQRFVEFLVDLSTSVGFFGGSSQIC